jgi:hypothetical protein
MSDSESETNLDLSNVCGCSDRPGLPAWIAALPIRLLTPSNSAPNLHNTITTSAVRCGHQVQSCCRGLQQ